MIRFAKNNSKKVHEIWTEYPQKAQEIITVSLRKVCKVAKDSMDIISEIFGEKLSENSKYLDYLNDSYIGNQDEDSSIEIKASNKDEKRVFNSLEDLEDKIAYKVGCTVNLNGTNPLHQLYFVCKTCDRVARKEIKVCASCVRF